MSFLINYAETYEMLVEFLKTAYDYTKIGGRLIGVNMNPFLKINEFKEHEKYGFHLSFEEEEYVEGKKIFIKNINVDMNLDVEYYNYYWSPETYERAFKEVGWKNFEWVRFSPEESESDELKEFFGNNQ
jgi:hypothetical protein